MFNNNKNEDTMSKDINTFQHNNNGTEDDSMNMISERSEIIGTLKSRRNIKIAGKIDGGVEAEGKVIVAPTGYVEGSINSEESIIAGKVEGDIHATGKLTLASSANVESDLYSQNLVIEEGAVFNGVCHMEQESTDNQWNTADEEEIDDELFAEEE